MRDAPSVKVLTECCECVGCITFHRKGGVAVVIDPGSPSSSGAVIIKQFVVGFILLY